MPWGEDYQMSFRERRTAAVLVVDKDPVDLENLRETLLSLGYGVVHPVNDHDTGLKVLQERRFTHIIFTAEATNLSAQEFLTRAMRLDSALVSIPTSYRPEAEQIFELLRQGARGFLVKPFSKATLEAAILEATNGEGFSRSILEAEDRNPAFAAMLAGSLDKLADGCRFSRVSNRAPSTQDFAEFSTSVRMSRTFAQGGEQSLLEAIVDFFVKIAQGPATRLGRLRRRLREQREQERRSAPR